VLLKGGGRRGSGLRVRPHGARRTVTLSAAAAVALLASGYVVFFSNVIHGPAEAMESGDYRRLMLEAAANQAKIDSLEQVVGNLTRSVQSGDVSQADANQQISALQSEIQQAAASLDVARKAADAQLDEDQRGDEKKESKSQSESRGEPLPGGSDGAAAAPGAAPDSGPARPLVEIMPAVTEPSPPGSDSVSGGDAAAFGSAPLEPETVSVVSVDVEPMTALPAAASSGGDGGGPEEPAPETRAPAAADYGLAAIRRSPTFVPVDAHPKPRSPLRPKYPPALAERKIGGTVTLWVLVNVGGLVEDVRVLRSSGQPELDKAAMDAIRRSPYDPASRDGVAVPAWTQQRIAFKLD
jgi:protein TonB